VEISGVLILRAVKNQDAMCLFGEKVSSW